MERFQNFSDGELSVLLVALDGRYRELRRDEPDSEDADLARNLMIDVSKALQSRAGIDAR